MYKVWFENIIIFIKGNVLISKKANFIFRKQSVEIIMQTLEKVNNSHETLNSINIKCSLFKLDYFYCSNFIESAVYIIPWFFYLSKFHLFHLSEPLFSTYIHVSNNLLK